jgi:hypothetical protein
MKEKFENPKRQEECDTDYEKRIVKAFYLRMFN